MFSLDLFSSKLMSFLICMIFLLKMLLYIIYKVTIVVPFRFKIILYFAAAISMTFSENVTRVNNNV